MKYHAGFLFLAVLVGYCAGSNILVLLPMPLYSHTNSYIPIFTELAKRGHNVTMVSPFPLKKPVPNFNEIVIEDRWDKIQHRSNDSFNPRNHDAFFYRVLGNLKFCSKMINEGLKAAGLKEFLSDTQMKFDLVITETFFCQEPFMAVGYKYGAIQVTIQTINLQMAAANLIGNPHNPSYVPSFKFPLSQHMNFWERSKNTAANLIETGVFNLLWIYMDYFMRNHFTSPGYNDLPPLKDMLKNISLILVDNHISLNYPRPYQPNVVEFGGLTAMEEEELPKDLKKIMDESQDGVIYFSWGSHFRTINVEPRIISAFLSAFGKLKQKVLMKVDQETLPGKPQNVFLSTWFPQASLLAHPNLRLFISHGGLHGITEATYYGVPILGTPLFADQEFNIKVAEEGGYCIKLDISTMTEDVLFDSLQKLLTNTSYKENAVKRSKIMKDRPLSGLDNAVYWIEYVLRHNGAPHLRSAAADLSCFQLLLLDVFAFWGAVFVLFMFLFYKLKSAYKTWRSKRKEKPKND